jgi:hypothetical protein
MWRSVFVHGKALNTICNATTHAVQFPREADSAPTPTLWITHTMPTIELTDEEMTSLRLVLALGMETYAKDIKKAKTPETAIANFERCMRVVYGKVTPHAWCGGELTYANFKRG